MIELKILDPDKKYDEEREIYVGIVINYGDDYLIRSSIVSELKDLSMLGKKVIFVINNVDDNGLFAIIINEWLNFSKKIYLETSNAAIQEIIELTWEEVEFVEPKCSSYISPVIVDRQNDDSEKKED